MTQCHDCENPTEDNKSRCNSCRLEINEKRRSLEAFRKQSGLCSKCGGPKDCAKRYCKECRFEASKQGQGLRNRRKENKMCIRCGKVEPADNKTKCQPCLDLCNTLERHISQEYKKTVMDHYGGKCECCSEIILAFLSIDHIDGGGSKHRKSLDRNGGAKFYRWIIKCNFPEGLRVLCFNCNCGRSINRGVCPHKDPNYIGSFTQTEIVIPPEV